MRNLTEMLLGFCIGWCSMTVFTAGCKEEDYLNVTIGTSMLILWFIYLFILHMKNNETI